MLGCGKGTKIDIVLKGIIHRIRVTNEVGIRLDHGLVFPLTITRMHGVSHVVVTRGIICRESTGKGSNLICFGVSMKDGGGGGR